MVAIGGGARSSESGEKLEDCEVNKMGDKEEEDMHSTATYISVYISSSGDHRARGGGASRYSGFVDAAVDIPEHHEYFD